MSRGVVEDAKRSCSGIGSMGHGECSDYAASGSAGREKSGGQEECLGRVVGRSGTQHLSEGVCVKVKGRVGTGHECSFYCTCWTDE